MQTVATPWEGSMEEDCDLLIRNVMQCKPKTCQDMPNKHELGFVETQMEQEQSITRVIKGAGPYSQGLVIAAGHHLPPLPVKGNAPYSRTVP